MGLINKTLFLHNYCLVHPPRSIPGYATATRRDQTWVYRGNCFENPGEGKYWPIISLQSPIELKAYYLIFYNSFFAALFVSHKAQKVIFYIFYNSFLKMTITNHQLTHFFLVKIWFFVFAKFRLTFKFNHFLIVMFRKQIFFMQNQLHS